MAGEVNVPFGGTVWAMFIAIASIAFSAGIYVGTDRSEGERVERNSAALKDISQRLQANDTTASRNDNRLDQLENWRKDIALLAESRDQRLKALEQAMAGSVAWQTEVIRRLARIEEHLTP